MVKGCDFNLYKTSNGAKLTPPQILGFAHMSPTPTFEIIVAAIFLPIPEIDWIVVYFSISFAEVITALIEAFGNLGVFLYTSLSYGHGFDPGILKWIFSSRYC